MAAITSICDRMASSLESRNFQISPAAEILIIGFWPSVNGVLTSALN